MRNSRSVSPWTTPSFIRPNPVTFWRSASKAPWYSWLWTSRELWSVWRPDTVYRVDADPHPLILGEDSPVTRRLRIAFPCGGRTRYYGSDVDQPLFWDVCGVVANLYGQLNGIPTVRKAAKKWISLPFAESRWYTTPPLI